VIEGILEIEPPPNAEIPYHKIRSIIYTLHRLGVKIRWITVDSFNATDMLQELNRKGFDETGIISMDKDLQAYNCLKNAFYTHTIEVPEHKKTLKELLQLEIDYEKNKVDHPMGGSKDCADALAGVVYSLSRMQETYHRFDIPLSEAPRSLQEIIGT
jgi:hypothetical protein